MGERTNSISGSAPVAASAANSDVAWRQLRAGKYRCWVRADLVNAGLSQILSLPPPGSMRYLKPFSNKAPSVVFRAPLQRVPIVVKYYRCTSFAECLKTAFRGSRAMRSWRWSMRLRELGVSAVEPVAVVTRCCQPWQSWFITEEIAKAQSIHDYLAQSGNQDRRGSVLEFVADAMARLHNAGIAHRDAHLANFLVRQDGHVLLIDFDGLADASKIRIEAAAHDLLRLLDYSPGTRLEHLRFIATYTQRRSTSISTRQLVSQMQRQRRGPGPLAHDA